MNGNFTILIVDDNRNNVDIVEQNLIESGFRVIKAYDGKEALERVKESNPDLILLDVMMPKLSGYEVCRYLKGNPQYSMIPIILLTARDDIDSKMEGFECGADDYLSKPINMLELVARVKAILHLKFLQDSLAQKNKELYAANKKLKELDQLKTDFTAMIVHDIRNPLTSVLYALECVEDFFNFKASIDETKQMLESGMTQVKRILNLVNDLLDIAKIEDDKLELVKEYFDITELIQYIITNVQPIIRERKQSIDSKFFQNQVLVYGDSEKISRVIENLLSNAIKFSPEGETITITLEPYEEDFIKVSVKDKGEGIPADVIPKLFDRFQQVRRRREGKMKGTGLGLTISKKFVEAHGGRIWVESVPNQGSTFSFTIPCKK